jgi:lipid-binding SYLF domain-containing protein
MKNVMMVFAAIITTVVLTGCGPSSKLPVSERISIIDQMEKETLQRLYEEEPSTKKEIRRAVGYGAFSNANINLIFASAGGGYGVVVDNRTGRRTYMKMGSGGIGLGLGAKDYRQVLIFKTRDAMTKFTTSGWDFGAHADAAAKAGETGGEASGEGNISEDISVYSMTEAGLALQATITGTKYWKDKDLN